MNQTETNCTLCERNCAMDALHCNRGRAAAGLPTSEGQKERHAEHSEPRGEARHGGGHGHGKHGHGHGHGHMQPHCVREERGRHAREQLGELGFLLHRCTRLMGHYHGEDHGQGRILDILAGQESLSQKELQDMLGIQPGSISEILSKLEDKGLVARSKDAEDKRKVQVAITQQGREKAQSLHAGQSGKDAFDVLSEEEQQQLTALLEKLATGWEAQYGKPCGRGRGRQEHPRGERGRGENKGRYGNPGQEGQDEGAAE